MSTLRVDEDHQPFILAVDEPTLENALGFDKEHWPDLVDHTWDNTGKVTEETKVLQSGGGGL